MATTDGGLHWRKLSPDLTRAPGEKPEPTPEAPANRRQRAGARGGRPAAAPAVPAAQPAAPPKATPVASGGQEPFEEDEEEEEEEGESQRPGFGGAIESISVSSVDGGVIWVGTSNGRIQVTQDHGATWADVTIPDLPDGARADISAIDASHHAAGTAYVAVDCHNAGDYKPYLYRTRDFGKTWTPIVNGLPDNQTSGSFARVIRADTVRDGLLFAGTESSVYVSFDDGDHWQPLTLNLPNTSYRDLVVKDDDLVAGTYGRGVWILDDISPLRQISASMTSEPAHLFKPGVAYRVRRNVNDDTPFPPEVPHAPNPPDGAIIYYSLAAQPQGEITLDVTDSTGKLVRHMSSAPIPPLAEPPPPIPDFWVEKPRPLPTAVGLNRVNWDLRCDAPPAFSHSYEISANPGGTPPSPEGPLVLPGTYTLTLTVDGKSYKQTVTVKNDPRSPASLADLRAQHALQMKAYDCTREAWEGYHQVAAVRDQIAALLKSNPPADVEKAATALQEKLTAVQGSVGFGRGFFGGGGFGRGGGPPAQPAFAQISGTAIRNLKAVDSGDMAPAEAARKAILTTCAEMNAAEKTWTALKAKDVPAFNLLLAKNNLQPVTVAGATTAHPSRMAGR